MPNELTVEDICQWFRVPLNEVPNIKRHNRMALYQRRLENFEEHLAVTQVILAAAMLDHAAEQFPHLVETALRRGDANMLGKLIIGAVDRWRAVEAEVKAHAG